MFKLKGISVGGTAVGISVGGGAWVGWAGVPQADRKKSKRILGTKTFQNMSLSFEWLWKEKAYQFLPQRNELCANDLNPFHNIII
jgi:hypothetical protein